MVVAYTKTQTVFINPRMLEEYFDIDDATALSPEEMAALFNKIPMVELIDMCETYSLESEVLK